MTETNITIIIDEEENQNNKNEENEENIQKNTELKQINDLTINEEKKYFWRNRKSPLINIWPEWTNRGRQTLSRLAARTPKNWSKLRIPKVSRRAENQIRNFGPLILLLSLFVYLLLGASAFLFFEHTNHEQMREIVNLLSRYEQHLELKMPDLNEWTLENSLTYCGGLITTIGHGHRSPKTGGGQSADYNLLNEKQKLITLSGSSISLLFSCICIITITGVWQNNTSERIKNKKIIEAKSDEENEKKITKYNIIIDETGNAKLNNPTIEYSLTENNLE
uniref:Ion_trans_2 domain-containing protein n=1 Tax=Meloidogyne hapla TaxID=6305 RepID=A0A1I8BF12_MELHA